MKYINPVFIFCVLALLSGAGGVLIVALIVERHIPGEILTAGELAFEACLLENAIVVIAVGFACGSYKSVAEFDLTSIISDAKYCVIGLNIFLVALLTYLFNN